MSSAFAPAGQNCSVLRCILSFFRTVPCRSIGEARFRLRSGTRRCLRISPTWQSIEKEDRAAVAGGPSLGRKRPRGRRQGAAAHAIFQTEKPRALMRLNFCARSPLRMAGALHDRPADDDACSKWRRQALLAFRTSDAANGLVPGRTLRRV
jgi:hypothetical protein